jgi:Holliday junction resolvasome RuvABC endonuclease subunit
MNHNNPKYFRLLAVALTSRGLGYAVLEGEHSLVESSHTSVRNADKHKQCMAKVKKLVAFYRPDMLVLPDVAAKKSRRSPRIKRLHKEVVNSAAKGKLPVDLISERQLRALLLGNPNGTKQEIAEMLAKRFPDDLALQLPPKRRLWESADSRMDIFDAVALAMAFQMKREKGRLLTFNKNCD